jgi:hypothetical protein
MSAHDEVFSFERSLLFQGNEANTVSTPRLADAATLTFASSDE